MDNDIPSLSGSALLRLFDQYEEDRHELALDEMARSFRPPVDEVKLRSALSLLCHAGLVQVRPHSGRSRYSITPKGLKAVDRHFTMDDGPSGRSFTAGSEEFDMNNYLRNDTEGIDWTRWGTILTGLGIIVAIILWWLN